MHIKKLSLLSLSFIYVVVFLFNSVVVYSADYTMSDCFTYTYNSATDVYDATFNTGTYKMVLNELNTTEIIMPEEYDDGINGKHDVVLSNSGFKTSSLTDDLITKIVFNSHSSRLTAIRPFRYFSKLNTVIFKYAGSDLNLGQVFYNCQDTLKRVDIYATALSSSFDASAFRTFIDIDNSEIHVASDSVRDAIVNATKNGSYPVPSEKIIVDPDLASSLPKPVITLSCEDITYGTVGGFKPSATVKVNGSPIEGAKITYDLYRDQSCTSKYSNGPFYDHIPADTYYLRATVEGTSEYTAAVSDPLEVHVTVAVLDKTKLDEAIKTAESFKSSAAQGD